MMPRPTLIRDAHAHIAQHGRAMDCLSLDDCADRDQCLDRLAAAAAGKTAGGWIVAVGARVETWPDPRWPTLAELERAVGETACCIRSFDYHSLLASPAALRAAGVDADTPDPPGGVILRDGAGAPRGVVLESAAKLVMDAVPEPTNEDRRRHVRSALADLARLGFAEIHDLHAPPWLGPELALLADAGDLDLHVALYVALDEIERVHRDAPLWERDRVRLAGAKVFADGTLNSRTAWMLEPYADSLPDHPRGKAMLTPDEIDAAIRCVDRLGLDLAVHAIGDAAVRAVLDAAERVRPEHARIRIEHAEIIDEQDVPRFAHLGVVASVQPCQLLPDVDVLNRLLPHRLDRVLPLRDLIDAGAAPGGLLVFGSDTPIVRPDPEDSILAAAKRRRQNMPEADAIAPEQAISEDEAWAAFAASL